MTEAVSRPFGLTRTTVEELCELIEVEAASELLCQLDVRDPEPRLERFVQRVPDLLHWLEEHGREYPWRYSSDPWEVYIAEILLQRTRGDTVEGVYSRFLDRFPSPRELHDADADTIKEIVEELGFGNQRTRTLQEVADLLVTDHGSEVPASLEELKRPWRVGPYSARACLVFAFDQPMALVDSNFARVINRVFGCELPRQPHKSDTVYRLLEALVPDDPGLARAFNLALIDLGALICQPSNPDCPACPLQQGCEFGIEQG